MSFIAVLNLLIAGSVQADAPVAMQVVYDRAYFIEATVRQSTRKGGGDWLVQDDVWRVDVQPTENGFKTIWHDRDAATFTPMQMETDQRLVPLRITNLDAVWSERGAAAVRFTQADQDLLANIEQTLPAPARFALLATPPTILAYGQGLELIVGEPLSRTMQTTSLGNGPPVLLNSTFVLQSADDMTDKAVVVWTTELEPKSVEAALPDMVRSVLGLSDVPTEKLAEFNDAIRTAVLINRRQCVYQIDMISGIAERVDCAGTMNVTVLGKTTKSETTLEATQRLIE